MTPYYRELANLLRRQIRNGSLRMGEKLPSIRELRKQTGRSITTVVRALQLLESEGLVSSRPKSGYHVIAMRKPPARLGRAPLRPTPTLVGIAAQVQTHLRETMDSALTPLGRAWPPGDLLPEKGLASAIRGALRTGARHPSLLAYELPPGIHALREQLARRSGLWGCPLEPDDFIITVGCTEAIQLALWATCKPGDTVAVESPTFFGILQMLAQLGLRVLEIPSHPSDGIDLEALEGLSRKYRISAILSIPSFNNPIGSCQPQAHRKALARLANRLDIPIIEDDLYGDLAFNGQRPWVVKHYDTEGRVLLCGSFSKSMGPGLRVGWVAPGRYYDAVVAAKLGSTYASPTLMQLAVAGFLKEGHYDRHLRAMQKQCSARMHRYRAEILASFPPGTRVSDPQGGFLLWVELPGEADAWSLYRKALAKGISIAPGPLFTANGTGLHHHIRLHGALPPTPGNLQAIREVGRLLGSMLS